MNLLRLLFPMRLPKYGIAALIALVIMNIIAYYGSRIITYSYYHHNFTTRLDEIIPFIPCAIIIYSVVAYAQWAYGFYLSACEDKKTVFFIFGAEIIAKIPSMIIFILLPTTMIRPAITGTDIFSFFIMKLYFLDKPDILFPSFHVLESYLLMRTSHLLKNAPGWYRPVTMLISPLVMLSILFVKQHVIVDIFGGIAVVEFGIVVMKIINRILDKKTQ